MVRQVLDENGYTHVAKSFESELHDVQWAPVPGRSVSDRTKAQRSPLVIRWMNRLVRASLQPVKIPDLLRRLRLHHQGLVGPVGRKPEEIVAHFGAVQAQDFEMAKWALALRSADLTDAQVAAAFDAGAILRTHVLRPTWHFVAPSDIRWMLQLSAPRVRAQMASHDRQYGIDAALLRRSRAVLERALRGGRHLTRDELQAELARHRIRVAGTGLAQVMIHAELDALVCSGPRRGKQFTYALLDERAPAAPIPDRATALAELARRYFQSHGPATARDFSWWSGLTLTEARAGIASLGRELACITREDAGYHFPAGSEPAPVRGAWLLPNYDEFTVAYADRSLLIGPGFPQVRDPRADPIFTNVMVVNGLIAGTWRRTLTAKEAKVSLSPFASLAPAARRAVARAADRFRTFAHPPAAAPFPPNRRPATARP